jgi:hypothetical protein
MNKKEQINKWIELALTRVKCIQSSAPTSYGLKHYCERAIGEYVSNKEMIDCMTELGFKKRNSCINSPNYHFNISKVVNKVNFENTRRCYENNNTVFHKKAKEINFL